MHLSWIVGSIKLSATSNYETKGLDNFIQMQILFALPQARVREFVEEF